MVGAGFAGAVYARALAEAGYRVSVVERRSHVAGNAFDYVDNRGTRVHKFGPHCFHTSNPVVIDWVNRFAEWLPYELRVRALIGPGQYAPLPISRRTIEIVHNVTLNSEEETASFLRDISRSIENPMTAEDHLYSRVGRELTDLLFRPYTRKMWGLDLSELAPSVVKRLPIRLDHEDRYFPDDTFQGLPKGGYTAMFERVFRHENIDVQLDCPFSTDMQSGFHHTFSSSAIDEYFDYRYGELPYRSIKFSHLIDEAGPSQWAITNFTDDGPFTRETHWADFPEHAQDKSPHSTMTREAPCDYKDNDYERYYPVKTPDDRYGQIYARYKALADEEQRITFIGRCGTYQYLDMHQVINQSLLGARRWIAEDFASS